MLHYKIIHRTYYNHSSPVSLDPNSLRLWPREDYELRIKSFSLNISPSGAKLLWHRDVEGNSVAIANFDSSTKSKKSY